ncbi:hypothetical protein [Nocardioides sp. SR21]|uniref:hypothetical protein n=1 Tax=Nocardioides sp. SR21 TaxID=2919501 RepID=UPI001FA9B910|nr:hypothetical protein [Nocardioides sp. SR21]
MADDTTRPPDATPRRQETSIRVATFVAWIAALVGLVDGIVLVLRRRETQCADGTYFPEGTTDFTCYVHPQLGLGVAVIVFSILLGILVSLASVSALTLVRGRKEAEAR